MMVVGLMHPALVVSGVLAGLVMAACGSAMVFIAWAWPVPDSPRRDQVMVALAGLVAIVFGALVALISTGVL